MARNAMAEMREAIAAVLRDRDGPDCQLCGEPIEDKYDLDHIIPVSWGGENRIENYRIAHPSCNRSRPKAKPSYMDEPAEILALKHELFELHHEFSWLREQGPGPSFEMIDRRDELCRMIRDAGYQPTNYEPPANWHCPH